uniref:Cadherin domain-containing protein n=2 Tax=Caenorhabditis japonica TaxID=281687 RepID=A0A8R1I0P2_CAEJA
DLYTIEAEVSSPVLGNIRARSPNPVVYRVVEGRSDIYKIDPNGDVRYTGKLLKEDRQDEIMVAVQESTGGLKMASTKLVIHLQGIGSFPVTTSDDSETIELISADEPSGVVISSVQFSDQDQDAKLEYTLSADNGVDENGNVVADEEATEFFEIKQGEDNQAHLVVKNSLLNSNISTVNLEITARDGAHPKEPATSVRRVIVIPREPESQTDQVSLNLVPFPRNITIPRNLPTGSFIYRAVVLPKKNNLTFSIEPEHIFKIFSDGSIITQKELTEEPQTINLTVEVTDGTGRKSSTESTQIVLKKTSKAHFSEQLYEANVPRGSPEGTVVTLVSAVNAKGEPVRDFVLKGGNSKLFTVDEQGTIKTNGDLSTGAEFDFLVAVASDSTVNAPVHVELAEPRSPSINLVENQIFATVFDNLPINSYVGKFEVQGDEKVTFSMSSDEKGMSNLFAIEQDGTIRSTDWLSGFEGMHKLSVLASNMDPAGVRSTNATVVVDVIKSNECVPRFKKYENLIFYVRENTPQDTVIGKVSAEILPGKCDLKYSLGNEEILTINPANGELKTAKEFDFEKQKSHLLTLKLVAAEHNSVETTAELRIMDVDDHKVRFDLTEQTVEVPEDIPPSAVIATVRAVEEDDQPVFYHLGPSSPPQFSLHSTTGAVIVEQPLDREENYKFTIEIGASNSADTLPAEWLGSMKLIVLVKDVNDNGPMFDRTHYSAVVDKDIVIGSRIIELHAADPDVEDQGKKLEYSVTGASFEYRGMSRNVEDVFDINPVDGKVYTLKSLSDYVGGVFNVHLQVRDTVDGTIGKSGLKVYVHDNSDLLSMELPYAPSTVTTQIVDEFSQQLSNSTGLSALAKKISYKAPHGLMSTNSVDLQLIFFNKTIEEIVPAEKVLAVQEMRMRNSPNVVKGIPELRKPASPYLMIEKREDTFIQPELFCIVLGFLVLLAIVLSLCGMMACFSRSRFLREKKIVENEMAIKDAIQFPSNRSPALVSFKHYVPPTPEMYRNHEEHMYRSSNLNEKVGSYAVQQATIIVAEQEDKI